MITTKSYPDSVTANIARTILSDNGIEAHLFDESCNSTLQYPCIPVRLLVQDDMEDEALKLHDSTFPSMPDDPEIQ